MRRLIISKTYGVSYQPPLFEQTAHLDEASDMLADQRARLRQRTDAVPEATLHVPISRLPGVRLAAFSACIFGQSQILAHLGPEQKVGRA